LAAIPWPSACAGGIAGTLRLCQWWISCLLRIWAERGPPAVDRHDGAVDEACLRREEIADSCCDLLGAGDPAQRVEGTHLLLDPRCGPGLLAGQEGQITLRGDGPQGDRIHPDTAGAVVNG